jgi:glycosidase
MDLFDFTTLSEAINYLTAKGFKEDFKAEEKYIKALYCNKEYNPEDLKIVNCFRFDGMTNPADETILLALIADDGLKGTLVMSYGAEQGQNIELIKQIKK